MLLSRAASVRGREVVGGEVAVEVAALNKARVPKVGTTNKALLCGTR